MATVILFLLVVTTGYTQIEGLRQKLAQIVESKKADVGVAIFGFENKDTLSLLGNKFFPMQSVYKFHLALAVMNEIDKGRFTPDQKILILKSDLLTGTWSPIQKKYPEGNVELPLSEILNHTVSQSDNNGCDILFRLIGGPKVVEDYMRSIGIKDVSIQATEEEMHKDWDVQFTNLSTPTSATELLRKFYNREILSETSFNFILKIMRESTTGINRIKGQLPRKTLVAHKTGTSGANEQGVSAAVNDIGIVSLPNGNSFAISIFVSNSTEDLKTNEKIIADITKETYDFFTNQSR